MKVSLPEPYATTEQVLLENTVQSVAHSLEANVCEALDDLRADLSLLNCLPLEPGQRELAEELHGALVHAADLAAQLMAQTRPQS